MRRFGELVADVIDDMLAADFEDGFAERELPSEFPGADTAFLELVAAGEAAFPYDWVSDDAEMFTVRRPEVTPIAGWERRHARSVTAGTAVATRVRRSRPGQVDAAPSPCTAPVRTIDDSKPCR